MNPTPVAHLLAQLRSPEVAQRREAAEALSRHPHAREASLALVQAASDDDEQVREWSVATLESLGPPLPQHTAELAERLRDNRGDTAYWAATLLGRSSVAEPPVVTALAETLARSPEPAVRQRCAWALGKLAPKVKHPFPEVRRALEMAAASEDRRLARLASQALKQWPAR